MNELLLRPSDFILFAYRLFHVFLDSLTPWLTERCRLSIDGIRFRIGKSSVLCWFWSLSSMVICAGSYFRFSFVFLKSYDKCGSLSFSGIVTAVPIFGSVLLKSYNAYCWLFLDLIFFLVLCYFGECFELYCKNQLRAS